MTSSDWKIHKKLLDAGGLGSVVYILPARANGKMAAEREMVDELLASGRKVVYVRPEKKPVRGITLAGVLLDDGILSWERYERADRILQEILKGERNER